MKNIFRKRWSKWTDLSTGGFSATFYLLQARRHEDGRVQFRVAESRAAYNCPNITLADLSKINQ